MGRSASAGRDSGDAVFSAPLPTGRSFGPGGTLTAYILWLVQAGAFAFLALAMLSFSAADWPSPSAWPHAVPGHNWCGPAGSWLAFELFSLVGAGAWLLLLLWGVHLFVSGFVARVSHTPVRFLGACVMAVALAGAQALLVPGSGAIPDLGGGSIGTVLADRLSAPFGTLGSLAWLAVGGLIGAFIALDVWVILAPLWAINKVKAHAPGAMERAGQVAGTTAEASRGVAGFFSRLFGPRRDDAQRVPAGLPVWAEAKARKRAARKDAPGEQIDIEAGGVGATDSFVPEEHVVGSGDGAEPDGDAEPRATARKRGSAADAEPADDGADDAPAADDGDEAEGSEPEKRTFTPEELRAKIAKLPLRFAAQTKRAATEDDLRDIQSGGDMEGYKFPGLDLLEEPEANYPQEMERFIRDQAQALARALKEYKIDGEVVSMDSGPVITLYEVRLAAGTKVAALQAVSSDLARSLKAVNIRVVANTAGKDTVGIEVPNPNKEKVRLKELMTKSEVFASMRLPMFLGKDAGGAPLIQDLTQMPHMLIAGTTGSGKSVCMSSILMSFLYTKKPNELKLVLVDPKMVEFSQFKDIPHLMCPVVTEMSKAAAILEWACRKMEERYELLVEAGCRDIAGYNAMSWEELKERFRPESEQEEARIPRKLPYMVFVIDELADLMMTNKEVEHSIVRLAQKARAVGIHLIVATQRPQANVVTGLIKSNMPARICFKVASGMDSRIVMDQKGGELLLGHGDMLYKSPRTTELVRAQGSLVDDREIRRVVNFMRDVATPTFERSLMQIRSSGEETEEGEGGGVSNDGLLNAQQDPLFDKAVEIALETKIGSVSMLQRRLAIGYTRSSRLIDTMSAAGILGNHKGTVAREVLISADEWYAMKAQALADER
ncbi:MAG: DNA translocase FtsK 4TM domain-containing protein, partial [Phycisphaerae bacterium]|nr:DNA translocase FtsK 4TM domain-containing protein [Phycisphaerae bacterium]